MFGWRFGVDTHMTQSSNDLSVRQYKRYQCDLSSSVRLDDADAAAVQFSPVASPSPRSLDVRVTDTSHGGLGLSSAVYIPPGTRLVVVLDMGDSASEFQVRVQRVRMTDRTPTFYLGTAFSGTSAEQGANIAKLLARCAQAEGVVRAQR